jgi:hypothetical protein
MAGLLETWSNVEVCSMIRFLHVKGTRAAEIYRQLLDMRMEDIIRLHINARPATLVSYGAMSGRLCTAHNTALTSHQVISISSDP